MSTDPIVVFLGVEIQRSTLFLVSGVIGGFMPFLVDLIQRQKQLSEERVAIDADFLVLKMFIIPLFALLVTGLAVATSNVTTWIAALYLGASLPMLAQKSLAVKEPISTDRDA